MTGKTDSQTAGREPLPAERPPLPGADVDARRRFWLKVDKRGPRSGRSGRCWLWTGAIGARGFGVKNLGRKPWYVHRLAYEWLIGPIPEGRQVRHRCGVRTCVNPKHLELAERRRSPERVEFLGIQLTPTQVRRRRCDRGHLYTKRNTYIDERGKRVCRACERLRSPGGSLWRSPQGRFWSKVYLDGPQRGGQPPSERCWLWRGATRLSGVGVFKAETGGLHREAHRLAYEWLVGPIPKGRPLRHRCGVPNCVNPSHLRVSEPKPAGLHGAQLTPSQRVPRRCYRGHLLDEGNSYTDARGWRRCLDCKRMRTPENRFWKKVDKGHPPPRELPELGGCWLWKGALQNGFGVFAPRTGGPERLVHRLAYEWLVGPLPVRRRIRHRCGVRACVNPEHLELVRPNVDE